MIGKTGIAAASLVVCFALPAQAIDCATIVGNQITPCGFENAAEVAAWTVLDGAAFFDAGAGENGGAAGGFAGLRLNEFDLLEFFLTLRSPCFSAQPGQTFDLGYAVQLVIDLGTAPGCRVGYQQWSNAGCTVPNGGSLAGSFLGSPVIAGAVYAPVIGSHTVGAGTLTMSLLLQCRGAGDFKVLADNAFATLAPPTIATTASPGIVLGAGTLTDNATVSGPSNPQASATITFTLFGPGDATCTGTPVFSPAPVPYPVAGGAVTSPAFTPTQAGTYRWIASYSGDANNAAVTGACNDPNETAVVAPATPTIATSTPPNRPLGGTITDTAVISGRVNPVTGATIDFGLYGPDDATCSGIPVFESLGVPYPVAGGQVSSAAFTPTTVGTYRWIASYSGDANNAPVAGACNDPNENVIVAAALSMAEIPTLGTYGMSILALVLAGLASLTLRRRSRARH